VNEVGCLEEVQIHTPTVIGHVARLESGDGASGGKGRARKTKVKGIEEAEMGDCRIIKGSRRIWTMLLMKILSFNRIYPHVECRGGL
jgi:hypothetical protein